MMQTTITRFEEVKRSKKVKGVCQKCSRERTRTVSISETVNPYNRNKDGTIKNPHEVCLSVCSRLVTAIDNMQKNFICATCQNNLPWPHLWPEKKKEKEEQNVSTL
jgi:hypothetical protein